MRLGIELNCILGFGGLWLWRLLSKTKFELTPKTKCGLAPLRTSDQLATAEKSSRQSRCRGNTWVSRWKHNSRQRRATAAATRHRSCTGRRALGAQSMRALGRCLRAVYRRRPTDRPRDDRLSASSTSILSFARWLLLPSLPCLGTSHCIVPSPPQSLHAQTRSHTCTVSNVA